MPSTPFIGVRISWLTLATNSDFSRAASSASSRAMTSSCSARRRSMNWPRKPAIDDQRRLELRVALVHGVSDELEHAEAAPVAEDRHRRARSGGRARHDLSRCLKRSSLEHVGDPDRRARVPGGADEALAARERHRVAAGRADRVERLLVRRPHRRSCAARRRRAARPRRTPSRARRRPRARAAASPRATLGRLRQHARGGVLGRRRGARRGRARRRRGRSTVAPSIRSPLRSGVTVKSTSAWVPSLRGIGWRRPVAALAVLAASATTGDLSPVGTRVPTQVRVACQLGGDRVGVDDAARGRTW